MNTKESKAEQQTGQGEALGVWKRIPYGNYTFALVRAGGCVVTRLGRYVGTFGNARIAENYVNSLIQ